ncbi:MAG: tetratricopeptide repeat protein [Acidobacteria bacterium]|nr:tetratricopeptide repeat protein [Acidobacteriota bacterium]
MSSAAVRAAVVGVALLVSSACAVKHDTFVNRFVKPGVPGVSFGEPLPAPADRDLQGYSHKLRELQAKAKPKPSLLPTIESRDPGLADALLRLTLNATGENHRRVAAAYRKAGVSDYAYRHYQRAIRIDPCDASSHEGLAQLWRDWGMPAAALTDAYRAIHCRPDSAAAYNTLGTTMQALGQHKNARSAYSRALELDPAAAYALNNLCYLSIQEGDTLAAQKACAQALSADPSMTAARNNLALAYAIQGDIARAEGLLLENADPVIGQYNVGILRMSLGRFAGAAHAFDVAATRRPSLWDAHRRAAQARARDIEHREP